MKVLIEKINYYKDQLNKTIVSIDSNNSLLDSLNSKKIELENSNPANDYNIHPNK